MPGSPDNVVWDDDRLTSPHTQQDKSQRVRRMFDQIAPTYELVNTLASGGRDSYWRRMMVRLAKVRADDVLLDVACGTGDVARTFAGAPVAPQHIIGADFSEGMLRYAAARSTRWKSLTRDGPVHVSERPVPHARGPDILTTSPSAGRPAEGKESRPQRRPKRRPPVARRRHTDFCLADALHLPLADGSVSIVSCAFGIRNFQDLGAGLREMYRVLQPGGRAVLLEFSLPEHGILRRMYLFYLNHILPAAATLVSRDRTGAYRYLPSSVLSFHGRGAIQAALKKAGFSRTSVHPLSLGIVAVYVACKTDLSPHVGEELIDG